eukprot:scaffold3337_cov169-Amphora_coffeaeformis.AAC.35
MKLQHHKSLPNGSDACSTTSTVATVESDDSSLIFTSLEPPIVDCDDASIIFPSLEPPIDCDDSSIIFTFLEPVQRKKRSRHLRKSKSALNLSSSFGSKSNIRQGLHKSKSVQFVCDQDGEVLHQEHHFVPISDPSLWWNDDEMRSIREACFHVVRKVKSTSKMDVSYEEVRGLERYVVPSKDCVKEHRRLVLESQNGRSFYDDTVCQAVKKVSKASQKFAERAAKLDCREALKSTLTQWERQPVSLD